MLEAALIVLALVVLLWNRPGLLAVVLSLGFWGYAALQFAHLFGG